MPRRLPRRSVLASHSTDKMSQVIRINWNCSGYTKVYSPHLSSVHTAASKDLNYYIQYPLSNSHVKSVNLFEICDLFSGHFILLHCGAKEKLLAVQEKMTNSVTFSFSRRGLRQNEEIISRINSAAVDRKETLRCNCWSRKVILNFLKIKGVIVFLILFQSQQCFVPPQGWGRIYIFFSPKRVLIRRCSLYLQPHSSDVLCNRLFI